MVASGHSDRQQRSRSAFLLLLHCRGHGRRANRKTTAPNAWLESMVRSFVPCCRLPALPILTSQVISAPFHACRSIHVRARSDRSSPRPPSHSIPILGVTVPCPPRQPPGCAAKPRTSTPAKPRRARPFHTATLRASPYPPLRAVPQQDHIRCSGMFITRSRRPATCVTIELNSSCMSNTAANSRARFSKSRMRPNSATSTSRALS